MDPRLLAQLDDAERASDASNRPAETSGPVMGCPGTSSHAIEVLVVGEDEQPLVDVAVALYDGSTRARYSVTRHSGRARFDGLSPGNFTLTFPDWDRDAWIALRQESIAPSIQGPLAPITWEPSRDVVANVIEHTVLAGECLADLAFRHGFALRTLWEAPSNVALREAGRSPYLLQPGESVHIPERRQNSMVATLDTRHIVKRKDVPETFQVRFLDWRGEPRRDLPCIVRTHSADGKPLPDRPGRLDGDGILKHAIAPDAVTVEVLLQTGFLVEPYVFQLGHIDPADSDSGFAGRAQALGFSQRRDRALQPEELAWMCQALGEESLDDLSEVLKRRLAALYRS